MNHLKPVFGLACCALLAACALLPAGIFSEPTRLDDAATGVEITPTPFQPIPPTPTSSSAHEMIVTPVSPTLSPVAATPTGLPASGVIPSDVITILVLGSDKRAGGGFRTDVIQLVAIRPDSASANIVSFPRDLYLTIPGVGPERINTAFEIGGFDLMQQTFMYNFGLKPEHYILTDFNGFIQIVDTLGGIDVDVEEELTDQCDLPIGIKGECTVKPGIHTMDGATALWYVRSRHSTSDFDRGWRAQEVIGGMVRKLLSLQAVSKAPDLYDTLHESVETDLSLEELLKLVPVLPGLAEADHIRRYSIGPNQGTPYILPESGYWVFLPDLVSIQIILQQAMYFP